MKIDIPILFEDQDLVVVNKPAGMVVNRARSYQGETLQDWFESTYSQAGKQAVSEWSSLLPDAFDDSYGAPTDIWQERTGMVHRLDKDTSGVLVFAKNPGSLLNLLYQFKMRKTSKKYLCLVHGGFSVKSDTIRMPLSRSSTDRQRFTVKIGGRMAVTHYEVTAYFGNIDFTKFTQLDTLTLKELRHKAAHLYQGFSVVECKIETGRTHQIRVHLASLQHPIVGDSTYTGKKRAKLDQLWCPRQFLHAAELQLQHPRTHELLTVTAPLTPDLSQVLSLLDDEH